MTDTPIRKEPVVKSTVEKTKNFIKTNRTHIIAYSTIVASAALVIYSQRNVIVSMTKFIEQKELGDEYIQMLLDDI